MYKVVDVPLRYAKKGERFLILKTYSGDMVELDDASNDIFKVILGRAEEVAISTIVDIIAENTKFEVSNKADAANEILGLLTFLVEKNILQEVKHE